MTAYDQVTENLKQNPRTWLVTGVAGFIGSHILEVLLEIGQTVIGIDNLSTGSPANLDDVRSKVSDEAWTRFLFREASVTDMNACREACRNVDFVLHQAGFVSVPLSMEDPIACHQVNVDGFLNILIAARDASVKRVVYASSSAVYGDSVSMPNREEIIGKPISPYGASKYIDEVYASTFKNAFAFESVGLRYFNVFGPRQNPAGGYAAVIPKWIDSLLDNKSCLINGDGSNTRDFCHVRNIVQANILAATTDNKEAIGEVFNVALGHHTSLNELHALIVEKLSRHHPAARTLNPIYGEPRPGDILHSEADISKIKKLLQYEPLVSVEQGLETAAAWYFNQQNS